MILQEENYVKISR